MHELLEILIATAVALFVTSWIHPYILKVAMKKQIVDCPDARKLQRVPIPVLGGLSVVFGIMSGVMAISLFRENYTFFPVFASIIIIHIIGFLDDTISLSPRVRFIIEIILILFLIYTTGYQLSNFHGLWGLNEIPGYLSVPLTVFAAVGIINSINLIDGVDGYSSGYSIVSSILFGAMFYTIGNLNMLALSTIVAVTLLPFFLHNVFGKRSKMFIGDSGTLALGIIFSYFVIAMLFQPVEKAVRPNLGLVPFTLSVLCIPVFDTLRVMSARIVRGKSPFSPDKTHLHHLFIELGYSHIGTSLSIIGINLFVVLCWLLAFQCGLSIDVQFYIVISAGLSVTFLFYPFMKKQIRQETALYRFFKRLGKGTHIEGKGCWAFMQKWADRTVIDDEPQN